MISLNRWYPSVLLVYFIAIVFVCYFSIQNHFISILIPVAFAFFAFFILLKFIDSKEKFKEILFLIFLVKITIVFSFPHLSDDIYRFWWDGFLASNGYNPYDYSPKEFMFQFQNTEIYESLKGNYANLNSANYPTAYPLICQWIFHLCAYLSGDNLYVFNLSLKGIFLIADSLILFFLLKILDNFPVNQKSAFLFYANPLVIIELNGNLHFEMFLILFFVISIYFFEKKKFFLSGFQLGLSIISKLVSFLWLPLFLKKEFLKKNNIFFLIGLLLPTGLFFISILPSATNYQNGLGLYFKIFEFNSFLYGPLFTFFHNMKWYLLESKLSLILMSIFCLFYLILITREWINNHQGFSFKSAWLILFSYLIFNTTIHPWYLTPLILLSVFSFKQPGMVWSFLIFLSYARYDSFYKPYESYLILLEYLVVIGFFLFELCKPKLVIGNR